MRYLAPVTISELSRPILVLIAFLATRCAAEAPPGGPESLCNKACVTDAPHCRSDQCARGCNLILDRLAEHEGDRVIACVARDHASCDDRRWAFCAVRVGPHVDGGPPAPPLPNDDLE